MWSTPMEISAVWGYFTKCGDFNPTSTCKLAGVRRLLFLDVFQEVRKNPLSGGFCDRFRGGQVT